MRHSCAASRCGRPTAGSAGRRRHQTADGHDASAQPGTDNPAPLSAESTRDVGQSAYHLKMNTTRIQHLIAGGALAASAILGAPTAVAQPDNPADPGKPPNPDVPTNANDARCIAQPFVLACGGSKFGGVPGAFDNLPGEAGDVPGMGGIGGMAGMGGGMGGI